MHFWTKVINWFAPPVTKEEVTPWKFEYFKSPKNNKWYFRMRAANGEVVCSSRQAYSNKADCVHTMNRIKMMALHSVIMDVTKENEQA